MLAVPPRMLNQAPPRPPFLTHILTEPPILASQQQIISAAFNPMELQSQMTNDGSHNCLGLIQGYLHLLSC